MPVCGSGAVVSSWSLLCGTHPGRFQAETPLIPLFRFPKPALALGGRTGASAALLTLAACAVFLIPLALLGHNLAENVAQLAINLQEWRSNGLPEPPSWVAPLPLVGSRMHQFWSDLAGGSVEATAKLEPYVQYARTQILG